MFHASLPPSVWPPSSCWAVPAAAQAAAPSTVGVAHSVQVKDGRHGDGDRRDDGRWGNDRRDHGRWGHHRNNGRWGHDHRNHGRWGHNRHDRGYWGHNLFRSR